MTCKLKLGNTVLDMELKDAFRFIEDLVKTTGSEYQFELTALKTPATRMPQARRSKIQTATNTDQSHSLPSDQSTL